MHTDFQIWQKTALGQQLLEQEQQATAELAKGLFGYFLLQLGGHRDYLACLDACHMNHKYLMGPFDSDIDIAVIAEQLPIASDSIDAILLPHGLDFSSNPQQVLREVERMLIPEGHLLISGFNPLSLWGLRRFIPGARDSVPWGGHFISYPRLADWLSLLGFDIEEKRLLAFRPPLTNFGINKRWPGLEQWGERFIPWIAGVYMIKAVKRVSTITPVRPKWHLRSEKARQVVEPSRSVRR